MSEIRFAGIIFDLDGVITATARVHALAWESMFNAFLEQYCGREDKPFMPFDRYDDYLEYVDGKPRYEGVKSFLQARGIHLPYGSPDDAPGAETVCGLGNRKNEDYRRLLREEGPEVFETSVEFVKILKEAGIRVGVATSSRNCRLVLELAGLTDLFETVVDGVVSEELNLRGKPDPDIFVTAAENMGLLPSECCVVEDAISGVQAGLSGNFGLVVGVARNIDGELLRRFGADIVVTDLGEISLPVIMEWFRTGLEADSWKLEYVGHDPGDEKLRETLTTVGNGYLGTRGCFEGERASFNYYPGTYLAGVYNTLPSEVHGRTIRNNDLVNCPNWLPIEIAIGSSGFISPLSMELLSYTHTLHMKKGIMRRTVLCKDRLGRITRIHSKRLASMHNPHLCAICYRITPLNYSGRITVRSYLDGNVVNDGVARYRGLSNRHLEFVDSGETEDGVYLRVRTSESGHNVVMQAKHLVRIEQREQEVEKRYYAEAAAVGEEMALEVRENDTFVLEKVVAIASSQSAGPDDLFVFGRDQLATASSFAAVRGPHVKAWKNLWRRADIRIGGDRFVQKVVRLHIYHLLVTASPHNTGLDAGMPARGLHGESYRGHVFWDELYILPFFDLHFPAISRALLLYRCRRLGAARALAREHGYEGAMYPWQSADSGGEETQEMHYNPESEEWGPDLSRQQRHVSIAVFYNLWRYVSITDDQEFLHEHAAEVMLEIARFWASIARYDEKDEKYHISGVMGPDEFHEKLPGADEPGLTDNAYTNIMVVWLLLRAMEMVEELPDGVLTELKRRTGFRKADMQRWVRITRHMNVEVAPDGILSQFRGWMDLKELDWDAYARRYYSIERMDRILKAEGDSPNNYKIVKQADALMVFYVLSPNEVARILRSLGHDVYDPLEFLRDNYDYYEKRTTHGSTLSKVVHSVISSYIDVGCTAWDWFLDAMRSDIHDTQGGTTTEGIHTGVMAGTISVISRYFAGINLLGEMPIVNPHMPGHWQGLSFSFKHRKIRYTFAFGTDSVKVRVETRGKRSVPLMLQGREVHVPPGEEHEFKFRRQILAVR